MVRYLLLLTLLCACTQQPDIADKLRKLGAATNSGIDNTQARQPRMWMENRDGRTYQCNDIGGTVNCN